MFVMNRVLAFQVGEAVERDLWKRPASESPVSIRVQVRLVWSTGARSWAASAFASFQEQPDECLHHSCDGRALALWEPGITSHRNRGFERLRDGWIRHESVW